MWSRKISGYLDEVLTDTPVVILQGPRQCGKTTLVQNRPGTTYITLDDSLALDAALLRPDAFLAAHTGPVVVDEIQRAPQLFRNIKKLVDQDRTPGRFLLTGSANVLLIPKLSESLAGRMEVVPLGPLTQAEVEGSPGQFVDWAFSGEPAPALPPVPNLDERMRTGGYPEPLTRKSDSRRQAWFSQYLRAILERDVRDLAKIDGLTLLPRVLRAVARDAGEPLNISELSRETGIPHTTLTRYLALMEAAFLTWTAPAWGPPDGVMATRTGKIYIADTGLLGHLTGGVEVPGMRETFVANELRALCTWSETRPEVMHFRSIRRYRVPLVLRAPDGRLVAVALAPDGNPSPADFDGLRFLKELAGPEWCRGVLLHPGEQTQNVEPDLQALPMSALWHF
ncbi:MAG: ATP-binding protein [Armatimonadota bacterium]|nr:ATP-binding protein [Fimbriimonadaceae bacterium]MCZ8137878.1 ATP-binding protein [Fimbriimonadaceae bacterium]